MDQISIKTPKPKCRLYWHLIVYRLEILSVMLVFSTHLCELLPLSPSLWFKSPTPLPFPVWTSLLYTSIQCVRGGYGVLGLRRLTPAAKSLYRSIFLDNEILHCLLWVSSFGMKSHLLPALGDAPLEEVLVHSRRDHVGSGLFARHGIWKYKKKFHLLRKSNSCEPAIHLSDGKAGWQIRFMWWHHARLERNQSPKNLNLMFLRYHIFWL